MNKTLYLRDEDGPIWDRARELSNDKLSPVVVAALKNFVAEKEAEAKGFQRIVLRFNDADEHDLPKGKAFYGRWIIPPEENCGYRESDDFRDTDRRCFAVAVTARNNIVIYHWRIDAESGADYAHRLSVYSTFEEAAADQSVNWAACRAMEKFGVPIEELDI